MNIYSEKPGFGSLCFHNAEANCMKNMNNWKRIKGRRNHRAIKCEGGKRKELESGENEAN